MGGEQSTSAPPPSTPPPSSESTTPPRNPAFNPNIVGSSSPPITASQTLQEASPNIPKIISGDNIYNITCGPNYKVTTSNANSIVSCTSGTSGFTSIVYEFKSRKNFNVENFSQNTNGKCKIRY
jgi:hypothetical protein